MSHLEKISQKITLTLLASQSLFSAAFIISFTVGSIIAVELAGGNERWAGVPSMLVLAGGATIAYPMGQLMDRIGRRRGLAMGFLLGITGTLLAGWAVVIRSLPLFLVGMLCLGLNRGTNDLGRYAAAEANPLHKRARAISWVVFGGTVGSVAGPILVDWVSRWAEAFSLPALSGPWFGAAFFLTISLILINIFLRPDPLAIAKEFADHEPANTTSSAAGRPYRDIFKHPYLKIATGAMVFGQLSMVTVMTITPVHMHGHHHTLAAISWVIMAHTFGMFGLSFVTGWLVDKLGQMRIIGLGSLMSAAACLLAPLWDHAFWLALSLFLLGWGWNFCFVAGSALLTSILGRAEKGRVQGLTDAMINIASGVGSVGSGLVFASFGFLLMSWLSIAIALLPLLLVMIFAGVKQGLVAEGVTSK